jgi:hypothetical protein
MLDRDARSVRVACDCANVKFVARNSLGVLWEYMPILRGRSRLISSLEFQDVVFWHEGRKSNKEAHRLARSVVLDEPGHQICLLALPK